MWETIVIHRLVANLICKIGRLKWPLLLVVTLAISLASGCGPSPSDVEPGTATPPLKAVQTPLAQPSPTIRASAAPSTFDDFLEEAFFAQITRDPELISQLGLAQAFGMDNSQLTNVSDAFQLETYQLLQTQLDTLHSYDRALLTPDQQLSYDLFEWYLDDLLRGQEWRFHDYPVNQTLGIQNILIEFMTDRHPLRDPQGAQDYVHRLEQFTTKFDQLIEWLIIQEAQGIIPPKFVIQRVLSQLNWYLSQDPEETALYSALEERVLPLSCINAASPPDLLLQHTPTVVFLVVLIATAIRHPLSNLTYTLLFLFFLLHLVGARHLYSFVPYDDWSEELFGVRIADIFGFRRNHYDRLVHLCFGLLILYPAEESQCHTFPFA